MLLAGVSLIEQHSKLVRLTSFGEIETVDRIVTLKCEQNVARLSHAKMIVSNIALGKRLTLRIDYLQSTETAQQPLLPNHANIQIEHSQEIRSLGEILDEHDDASLLERPF